MLYGILVVCAVVTLIVVMEYHMSYSTDLTDAQWEIIEPIITYRSEEDRYKGGRPRTVELRRIVDALLYQARTGVQWRLIPADFPPHATYPFRPYREAAHTIASLRSVISCGDEPHWIL